MPVVVKPLVQQKLLKLYKALLDKNCFATEEHANEYIVAIGVFIHSIPSRTARRTAHPGWGQFYTTYKPNRRTTWYITFEVIDDDGYIVRNITNNHASDYPRFVSGNQLFRSASCLTKQNGKRLGLLEEE